MTTNSIRSRIETGVLMSLGARNFRSGDNSLTFDATILPFNSGGERSTKARKMVVTIIEHSSVGLGQFGVYVSYPTRGTQVTHFQSDRIPSGRLNRTVFALDYDGDQVLNPRLA